MNSPAITKASFSCPHCGAHAHQRWHSTHSRSISKNGLPVIVNEELEEQFAQDPNFDEEQRERYLRFIRQASAGEVLFEKSGSYSGHDYDVLNLNISDCFSCRRKAVWLHERLVYPLVKADISPAADLPEEIRGDFEEARAVFEASPRAAAALLRLCIEKLCGVLQAEGKTLDAKIGDLVSKGLDSKIQRSLDAVRVIGNHSVHPGSLNINDNRNIAQMLFQLVNLIVEKTITEPRKIDEIYDMLPDSSRKAISRRDNAIKTKPENNH